MLPSGGRIGGGMIISQGQKIVPIQSNHQNRIIAGGMVLGGGQLNQNQPIMPRKPLGPKLMRLRCRFRPLHDAYIKNGNISEDDADVIFICGDGHQLCAHKVIMASSSTFFAKLFEDQANSTAIVSVPDIKVDIMKLILQLTYRDNVILTMKQIKEVGEFLTIFGMAWSQFSYEKYDGDEPMTASPMAPIPMEPVHVPQDVVFVSSRKSSPQRRQLSVAAQDNILNGSNNENELRREENAAGGTGEQNQNERHSRKSKLTPRPGAEGEGIVQQVEEEDPENKNWMARLGKRNPSASPPMPPVKKIRADSIDQPQQRKESQVTAPQAQPQQTPGGFKCSICNAPFRAQLAWRWHEDRHVGEGAFKCQFCDELLESPKQCYIHEKEFHGYNGMTAAGRAQQQPQQQQSTRHPVGLVTQPRKVLIRPSPNPPPSNKFVIGPTGGAGGYSAVSKKIKMATFKKVQAAQQQIRKPGIPPIRNSQIAIGESPGSEGIDKKKLKQLHWLYSCLRCDTCVDSMAKAMDHYEQCYDAEEGIAFENTVKKHRQGFYGKSICPFPNCPKRYPQNTGFMIHCGHQHPEYRRLFTHTGSADDKIKCVNCKEVFPVPNDFHDHLIQDANKMTFHCGKVTKADNGKTVSPSISAKQIAKNIVGRASTSGKTTKVARPKRVESPIEHKASYKVQFHTPPKSARLANRVKAEEEAEAAKLKQTNLNFPSVDCPVCGEGDIPNISLHLQTKHKDLKIDVTRVSSELLRCKNCTITFSICDLLDHKKCYQDKAQVGGESEEGTGDEGTASRTRRSSASSASGSAGRPKNVVVDPDTLPPGVGRSPIERIEMEDLHSIHAIRSALKCQVCGFTAKRLGVVAECLRAHGVHRCSLCFNSYCSKADYTAHLKKCHGAAGNKLKCPLCPKAFANAGQTSGHMYSTHWLQILKENELSGLTEEAGTAENSEENTMTEDQEVEDEQASADKGNEEGIGTKSESFEEDNGDTVQVVGSNDMDVDVEGTDDVEHT